MREIFFTLAPRGDSESDDLERTEIHRNLSAPSPIQSLDLQPPYREVDEPRPAPLAEAEERFPGIRRDAEGPRHVGVLTIQCLAVENITRGLSQEKCCIAATGSAGSRVEKTRGGKVYVTIRDITSAAR